MSDLCKALLYAKRLSSAKCTIESQVKSHSRWGSVDLCKCKICAFRLSGSRATFVCKNDIIFIMHSNIEHLLQQRMEFPVCIPFLLYIYHITFLNYKNN